jgi:hypothetical protein
MANSLWREFNLMPDTAPFGRLAFLEGDFGHSLRETKLTAAWLQLIWRASYAHRRF